MFAPTKIWRRWHIQVNKGQKRYATCAALAATAVAPLLMARGHRVAQLPEVPLVVADNDINPINKTKDAVALLKQLGLTAELQKVIDSRHVRAGKGKARNRKYVQAKGPLIIYNKSREESSIEQAFRNIPGVEIGHVRRLNLLKLAPGGHVGRLIIWTESAFKELNDVFGTRKRFSQQKRGYKPPRSVITNCDITRIINSPEIQSQLRLKKKTVRPMTKVNPIGNLRVMAKLNPYAVSAKRNSIKHARKVAAKTVEETKRDKKLQRARKTAEHKKNPRKTFKKLLHSPSVAPVRSDLEIGVLIGNK